MTTLLPPACQTLFCTLSYPPPAPRGCFRQVTVLHVVGILSNTGAFPGTQDDTEISSPPHPCYLEMAKRRAFSPSFPLAFLEQNF